LLAAALIGVSEVECGVGCAAQSGKGNVAGRAMEVEHDLAPPPGVAAAVAAAAAGRASRNKKSPTVVVPIHTLSRVDGWWMGVNGMLRVPTNASPARKE
jgi:hypothetical protein